MGKEEASEALEKTAQVDLSTEGRRQLPEWSPDSDPDGQRSEERPVDPLITTDVGSLPGNRHEADKGNSGPGRQRCEPVTKIDSNALLTVEGLKDSLKRIESAFSTGSHFEIPPDSDRPTDSPLLPDGSPTSSSPFFRRDVDLTSMVREDVGVLAFPSDNDTSKLFDANYLSDKDIEGCVDERVASGRNFNTVDTSDEDSLLNSSRNRNDTSEVQQYDVVGGDASSSDPGLGTAPSPSSVAGTILCDETAVDESAPRSTDCIEDGPAVNETLSSITSIDRETLADIDDKTTLQIGNKTLSCRTTDDSSEVHSDLVSEDSGTDNLPSVPSSTQCTTDICRNKSFVSDDVADKSDENTVNVTQDSTCEIDAIDRNFEDDKTTFLSLGGIDDRSDLSLRTIDKEVSSPLKETDNNSASSNETPPEERDERSSEVVDDETCGMEARDVGGNEAAPHVLEKVRDESPSLSGRENETPNFQIDAGGDGDVKGTPMEITRSADGDDPTVGYRDIPDGVNSASPDSVYSNRSDKWTDCKVSDTCSSSGGRNSLGDGIPDGGGAASIPLDEADDISSSGIMKTPSATNNAELFDRDSPLSPDENVCDEMNVDSKSDDVLSAASEDRVTVKTERFEFENLNSGDLNLSIKVEEMVLDNTEVRQSNEMTPLENENESSSDILVESASNPRTSTDKKQAKSRTVTIDKIAEKLVSGGRGKSLALQKTVENQEESDTGSDAVALLAAVFGYKNVPKITSAIEILRVDSPDAVRKKPDLTPSVSLIPTDAGGPTQKSCPAVPFKKQASLKESNLVAQILNLSSLKVELRPAQPSNPSARSQTRPADTPVRPAGNVTSQYADAAALPSHHACISVPISSLQKFGPTLKIPSCYPAPSVPRVIPKPASRKSYESPSGASSLRCVEAFYRTKTGALRTKFVKVPIPHYRSNKVDNFFAEGTARTCDPSTVSPQPPSVPDTDLVYASSPSTSSHDRTDLVPPSDAESLSASESHKSSEKSCYVHKPATPPPAFDDPGKADALKFRSKDIGVPDNILNILLHDNNKTENKTDSSKTDKSNEAGSSLASATGSLLKLSRAVPSGSEEVVFDSNDLKVILVQPESELHSSKKTSLIPLREADDVGAPETVRSKKKRGSEESAAAVESGRPVDGSEGGGSPPSRVMESIGPSKSPDIVLIPKSVADRAKNETADVAAADRSLQIVKVTSSDVQMNSDRPTAIRTDIARGPPDSSKKKHSDRGKHFYFHN